MNAPYRPIDCGLYDQLEVLAMKRQRCRIGFVGEDQSTRYVDSRVIDVFAKNGEEFIRTEDDQMIRLDRLRELDGRPLAAG